MLTMMLLTIKEAVRRRTVLAGGLMAMTFIGLLTLTGAFRRGHGGMLPIELQLGLITTFGLSMARFFGSVLGVVMAAGSISAEVENGTLYAIISKPVSRLPIMMGKWLGMVALSLGYMALWSFVVWAAVYWRAPESYHLALLKAAAISTLYPIMFISLTLLFSTFAQSPFASALALIVAGVGWSEGIQRSLGTIANIPVLLTGSHIVGYIVPMGRISRWVLEVSDVQLPFGVMGQGIVEQPATTPMDIGYVFLYIAVVICLGVVIFQKRDL